MTQPNPGPAPAGPEPNQNPPAAPATGPAPAPPIQPTPPGFVPAGAANTAAEDLAAQQLLDTAVAASGQGDPNQLGDAGKRALDAERAARKAAEDAAKADRQKMADLEKQIKALQPAADVFAQIRKAAVPDGDKTDMEKLTERLAAQEKATNDERLRRTQLEVTGDLKLGKEWVEFLRGDTYDEMKAYAEKLLALMPKPEPEPETAPEPTTVGDPPDEPGPKKKVPAPKPDPSQGARGATPSRSTSLGAAIQKAMSGGG